MTGSGSAVFGVFSTGEAVRHAARSFPAAGAFPVRFLTRSQYQRAWKVMAASKPVRALFTDFKVFSGTANLSLTEEICESLGCPLGAAMIKRFADGETHLQIQENVRGADVFLVQPTCTPVDHHLMELLLLLDALKRASAERITAVLPYYGYARQDRKDRPRMPISAKLVASLLETAGASRVLALDLHAAQIQGFFDIPVDHLFSAPVMVEYFEDAFRAGRSDNRFAGRRWRGARAIVCQAFECAAGDHR